ncbi:DNA polymerase III subunit delta', partial [Escherichia coli]|nr:DNA polymerase III subunit delta' [Escherichia coli]
FATKPSFSPRRVIVIDAIDDLERGGANALLKNLEEPPAGTIFLLVSHAPGRLLPTIRSRCRLLRFEALPDADVAAILR